MTKEEALRFKSRWKLVNEFTAEEARLAPAALKLRQLALMYEAAQTFGWDEALADDKEVVRERWRRLREARKVGTHSVV
jgi:hypothetical protein